MVAKIQRSVSFLQAGSQQHAPPCNVHQPHLTHASASPLRWSNRALPFVSATNDVTSKISVRPFASFIGHKANMMTLAPAQQHLLLCSSGHASHFINSMLPRFREARQRQLLDERKTRRDPRVELLMRLFSSAMAERLEGASRSTFQLPAHVSVEARCKLQVAPWQLGYDLERCPGSSCGSRYSIFNRRHTCRCGVFPCG
jgi:hypothetical protein